MKVSDYIIDFVSKLGVQHIFFVSGGGAMHLNDSLGKNNQVEGICMLHEQGAAIAAEAYARIHEGYGCCLVTSGPGATNALTGLAGAYMDSILKMKNPYDYFQAGVLVMNLAEFRKTYTTKQILEYADAYDYELLDQDILNHLCEGRVLYLDIRWNIMVDFNGIRIKENIRNAPKYLHDMYMEGRKNPYIVHYAGPQKPWMSPEMDMAEYFWQYARENVFYERILANMSTAITKRELDEQDASKKKLVDDTNLNPLKEVSAKLLPYDSGPREFIKKIYHFFVHTEWEVEAKELKEKNKNRGK